MLAGTPAEAAVVHLGAVLTGEQPVPDGTRVFLSAGLAGTKTWLLNAVLQASGGYDSDELS
ncbi:hypothetical protein ACQBAT_05095 [Ornithinimicrobium sp. Y1847]|uniref:hypothetical protein n=1 Tax=Ornithinimicrobium sp. Y1847 TaxID=3405419 RepID=UPI003B67FC3F